MTEHIVDNRETSITSVPHYKVSRIKYGHPEDDIRYYYVLEKVELDGKFAGWRNAIDKAYTHSTSAYAAMGRLFQEYIKDHNMELPYREV
jgi:hypothetical protein